MSRRRANTSSNNNGLSRSVSFSFSMNQQKPKPQDEEDEMTKMTWSKPSLLILDRESGTLTWYSLDKNYQKKTKIESINLKEARVRRSTQSEERRRPKKKSERRSEVRDDWSRGGFAVTNRRTSRETYFCICTLSKEDGDTLSIAKKLQVVILSPGPLKNTRT